MTVCVGHPSAEILAANYDVIMVDARGHGRSTGPEQGYGQDDHAADLAGLIKGLGLHRPSILGHSMGAVTALALAGLYPGIPGSILLEDPPAWWTPDAPVVRSTEWEARRRAHLVELKRKTREELIVRQACGIAWLVRSRTWAVGRFQIKTEL